LRRFAAFTVSESGNKVCFKINKAEGDSSVAPENRTYIVKLNDITDADVTVTVEGKSADAVIAKGRTLEVTVCAKNDATVEIVAENCTFLKNEDKKEALIKLISKFQMSTDRKGMLYTSFVKNSKSLPNASKDFKEPIEEILGMK
jgi:hypothetical protein